MVEPRSASAKSPPYRTLPSTLSILNPQPPFDPARPNMAASLTDSGLLYTQPVCQNCQTSTTPLWRRDEAGSVLCNACGLFLKLHGRARPISLKTDVIKSRNRVKSAGQVPKKKVILDVIQPVQCRNLTIWQPPFDANGLPATAPDMGTPPFNLQNPRRSSQKASSGASDRSHSPVSRTDTPHMQHDPNIAPQHIFDGVSLNDQVFQPSPSLPGLHLNHPSPGSTSSLNDRHLEPPQTYEQLFVANTQLKTKVSELEVINIMQRESAAREASDLTAEVDELKRRVKELQQSLKERDAGQPPSKKARLSDTKNE
jgi:GATA-binding protein